MEGKKSLSEQLGYYIGEYIVHHYLPTLSCGDIPQSNNLIEVSEEEVEEYEKLNRIWFKSALVERSNGTLEGDSEEWKALQKFNKIVKEKYIPEKLECPLPILVLDELNVDLFKKGLAFALWDCDMSHYSCDPEDIEIVLPKKKYDRTTIFLKRA